MFKKKYNLAGASQNLSEGFVWHTNISPKKSCSYIWVYAAQLCLVHLHMAISEPETNKSPATF